MKEHIDLSAEHAFEKGLKKAARELTWEKEKQIVSSFYTTLKNEL